MGPLGIRRFPYEHLIIGCLGIFLSPSEHLTIGPLGISSLHLNT